MGREINDHPQAQRAQLGDVLVKEVFIFGLMGEIKMSSIEWDVFWFFILLVLFTGILDNRLAAMEKRIIKKIEEISSN